MLAEPLRLRAGGHRLGRASQEGVVSGEGVGQASTKMESLERRHRRASWSGCCVSRSSAIKASSMARPETPKTSETMLECLVPTSLRSSSRRWASRVGSRAVSEQPHNWRTDSGGTNAVRTRLDSTSRATHCACATSVLRPATAFKWGRVEQPAPRLLLEQVELGVPLDPGGIHQDQGELLGARLLTHREQVPGHQGERPHILASARIGAWKHTFTSSLLMSIPGRLFETI